MAISANEISEYPENEEEIRVFYCLALKKRERNKKKVGEEIRNLSQNIWIIHYTFFI